MKKTTGETRDQKGLERILPEGVQASRATRRGAMTARHAAKAAGPSNRAMAAAQGRHLASASQDLILQKIARSGQNAHLSARNAVPAAKSASSANPVMAQDVTSVRRAAKAAPRSRRAMAREPQALPEAATAIARHAAASLSRENLRASLLLTSLLLASRARRAGTASRQQAAGRRANSTPWMNDAHHWRSMARPYFESAVNAGCAANIRPAARKHFQHSGACP